MSILSRATFSGGAHVPDMKAMSSGKAIETLPAPERAYISLSQHVGKPAIPIVSEGEKVLRGQLIAKADGAVSANIYSSVSGVVEEIKPISNHLGRHTYIVIRNDFLDETVWLEPIDDTDGNAIAERVKEAGLVGLGGAGFPSFIKLKPKEPIDILLINSAECEPYLTCDYRVLVEHTEQFVVGARYLSKALGGAKIYVGVEENKPDVIKTLSEYDDFFVVPLKKKYPQGSEKQLIYACTGRKVGLGKLPSTTGVVVMNVQTTKAVFDAVK
ncbi:MAG: RnfABCDGE type electron transport complex subunit C, partial [Clostridia bacterium]|nr:RnfABCDGE type electron transport complex subunit C [Clostridia bacterium]